VDPAAGGWSSLTEATAVSADGNTIVGWGTRNGNTEAFRAFVPNAVAPLPGDFNHDGNVNAADYVVWRKGLGTIYTQNDYGVWRAHFGSSLGPGSGSVLPSTGPLSAAVPEPATLILFGIGLVALSGDMALARRRVRQASQTRFAREARRWTVHNWLLNVGAKLVLILLTLLGTPRVSHAGLFFLPWDFSSEPPGVQWATYPLVADFTSDGILDRISSNWNEVVVRPGRGDGTFGDPIRSAIRPAWGAPLLAVADFSNDGRLDVFTFDWDFHDYYSIANVLLGSGNGRFSQWQTLDFATDWSGALGTGDIDHDGLTDVAIAAGHDPDTGLPYFTALFNDGDWPSVVPALPGDYNRNGAVDAADYVVWRKTLGTGRPNYSGADGNGNGVVDQDDHAVWRAHFGQTLPAGAGSLVAAVPEPASALLLLVGAAVGRCGRRRVRSALPYTH
jgi:hypothetical protein